ncbi:MAG: hypothetical protein FJ267_07640, partial [Planctomycetes bacterium]|nr:hypothetical protein [Planctomycetota bacterium]
MTRLISKIPVVGKTWKRIRKGQLVGTLIEEVKLRFQYGSRVPEFVSLPNSGSKLFLDRSEPRGRGMLLDGAIGQPGLKQI